MPGNIRKAEHFLPMLKKLLAYFSKLLNSTELKIITPLQLVKELSLPPYNIECRALKFAQARLQTLLNTLQIQ
jgi:DNA excision repair protein ERCC-2